MAHNTHTIWTTMCDKTGFLQIIQNADHMRMCDQFYANPVLPRMLRSEENAHAVGPIFCDKTGMDFAIRVI